MEPASKRTGHGMAENAPVAFGRYLRTLRGRRGLSLENVARLTRHDAGTVSKAYLSRVEHGSGMVSVVRLIALSRVYDVPLELLAERLELDLELDRRGAPDTRGATFEELHAAGLAASFEGSLWTAYAYFRDAIPLAVPDARPAPGTHEDDRRARAAIRWTAVAAELGKPSLALWELQALGDGLALSPPWTARLHQAIAERYRELGKLDGARERAAAALDAANACGDALISADGRAILGRIALDESRFEEARGHLERAYEAHREGHRLDLACRDLAGLARCFLGAGDTGRAMRCASSALRLARRIRARGVEPDLMLLLGDIAEACRAPEKAAVWWRRALDRWTASGDRVNRFRAELRLYRQAVAAGAAAVADALERRLSRTLPWVPRALAEATSFREIAASRVRPAAVAPAAAGRPRLPSRAGPGGEPFRAP